VTRLPVLRLSPAVAFHEVDVAEAQDLLIAWRHPLHLPHDEHPAGRPYSRPFGRLAFVMEAGGRRAAMVVLASTINASVCKARGWHRYNTVDVARIARSPDRRDQKCLRAMLRITREYLVPPWLGTYPRWDARSAELRGQPQIESLSSTSLPGTPGSMYRFDGFERSGFHVAPKDAATSSPVPRTPSPTARGVHGSTAFRNRQEPSTMDEDGPRMTSHSYEVPYETRIEACDPCSAVCQRFG
jgi:hypothetical protein